MLNGFNQGEKLSGDHEVKQKTDAEPEKIQNRC